MQELQVPTRRITVELSTDRGERFAGGLFVTEAPYHANRIEEVKQLLNDQRLFLPFDADHSGTDCHIINKAHVTRVKLEGRPEDLLSEEAEAQIEGKACQLRLTDGTQIEGELAVDTPWSMSRLVDKLNQAEPFVLVVTPTSVEFVQLRHIVCVN